MTNLMQQLQAWADDGSYDWENYAFRGCKHKDQIIRMAERFDPPLRYVKDVLDGTIQVWRPVEHYPPPENAEVLALFLVSENAGYEHGIVETNVEKGFTHWQPLPNSELVARLKGGKG
jgi:hypothetical protein